MVIPAASVCRRVEVIHLLGLHLRTAGQFVEVARRFTAEVRVRYNGAEADGKSTLDLICLGAGFGAVLELEASGQDAPAGRRDLGRAALPGEHEPGDAH